MRSQHFTGLAPKKVHTRLIDKRDPAIQIRSNQTAAHRVEDVFLHRLQVLQFIALHVQFDANLAQLCAQVAGKIGNCHVGKKVDTYDKLHCLKVRTRRRKRRNDLIERQVQNRAESDERERRG